MDAEDHLQRLIPYRLDCLATLSLMLELRRKWMQPKPMQILVDGKLQFEGMTSMFTNPIVEAGVLHIRALLEFLGLKVVNGNLRTVTPGQRKRDDAGIELLLIDGRTLGLVQPSDVQALHPAAPSEAEAALVAAINAAHKGMAHLTARYADSPVDAEQLLLAASITRDLVH